MTNVSRFAGRLECEQARERLEAARRRAEVEAQQQADGWLREQLKKVEADEARVCPANDATMEDEGQRRVLVELERAHAEAVQKLARLREKYLERHPQVRVTQAMVDRLRQELDKVRAAADSKLAPEAARVRKEIEQACGGAPRGRACEKAKERALALNLKEVDAARSRRECQQARTLAKALRDRVGRPGPTVGETPRPECRPE